MFFSFSPFPSENVWLTSTKCMFAYFKHECKSMRYPLVGYFFFLQNKKTLGQSCLSLSLWPPVSYFPSLVSVSVSVCLLLLSKEINSYYVYTFVFVRISFYFIPFFTFLFLCFTSSFLIFLFFCLSVCPVVRLKELNAFSLSHSIFLFRFLIIPLKHRFERKCRTGD